MSSLAALTPLPELVAIQNLLPDASNTSDRDWVEERLEIPAGTPRRKAILNSVYAVWRLRRIEDDVMNRELWQSHLASWLVRIWRLFSW
jgi:hypothetical protein